jgi:hypothetical protein
MAAPRLYGPTVAESFRTPGGNSPSRAPRSVLERGGVNEELTANRLAYSERRLADLDARAARIEADRAAGNRVRRLSPSKERERAALRQNIGDIRQGGARATTEVARRDANNAAKKGKKAGQTQAAAAKKAASAGKKAAPKTTAAKKAGKAAPTAAAAEGAISKPGLRGAKKAAAAAAKKGRPTKKVGTKAKFAPKPKPAAAAKKPAKRVAKQVGNTASKARKKG